MRTITKDIQLNVDGSLLSFRLTKPDAFSSVEILRLLLRLQDQASCHPEPSPCHPEPKAKDLTVLDLITSFPGMSSAPS